MNKKPVKKAAKAPVKAKPEKKSVRPWVWVVCLLVVTFITFRPALKNNFVNWDDDKLVLQNGDIQKISAANASKWFTSYYANMYHPLTVMVYAVEYRLFKLNPVYFHLVNLLLHLLNVVLVFYLIFKLIGKQWAAILTSALFALHPMHVESVVWVAELKDVLYSAFFLVSLILYIRHNDKPGGYKFLFFSFLFFLFSLLSKSAAVVLPVILFVLDFYMGRKFTKSLIIEKIPFFLLSLLFGVLSIKSQNVFGAEAVTVSHFTIMDRFFMTTYAFSFYLVKFLLPFKLSAVYPFPVREGNLLPWVYYISVIVVPAMAAMIYYLFKSKRIPPELKKDVLSGLFFFIISISLIISLPVGRAIAADRYSYIPYIGLSFIVFSITEHFRNRSGYKFRGYFIAFWIALLLFFALKSNNRIGYWGNSVTLFTDVINQYPEYPEAYNNRGLELFYQGKYDEAAADFAKSIEVKKDYAEAYFNYGLVFMKTNDYKTAIDKFDTAVYLGLNQYSLVYDYRGRARFQIKDYEGSMMDYNKALEVNPFSSDAYNDRGILKGAMGDNKAALEDFNLSIRHKKVNPEAYYNRGFAYFLLGDISQACSDWQLSAGQGSGIAPAMITQHCNKLK